MAETFQITAEINARLGSVGGLNQLEARLKGMKANISVDINARQTNRGLKGIETNLKSVSSAVRIATTEFKKLDIAMRVALERLRASSRNIIPGFDPKKVKSLIPGFGGVRGEIKATLTELNKLRAASRNIIPGFDPRAVSGSRGSFGVGDVRPLQRRLKLQKEIFSLQKQAGLDAIRTSKLLASQDARRIALDRLRSSSRNIIPGFDPKKASAAAAFGGIGQPAKKASQSIRQITTQTKLASSAMFEFGRVGGLALRRFAGFTIAAGTVFGFVRAITSGISEAIKFERELARVAQVTGKSEASLSFLTDRIGQLSTNFGVSSLELIKVSRSLSQAGFSARETEQALTALARSTLAPTFGNINQTVEGSIAILKQFNIEAKDLEGVLGSINAVAGRFAVEADDIIQAVKRTGGVFAQATPEIIGGREALNQFIATFTAIRSTTRETAQTIATGLRTIISRAQSIGTIKFLKGFGIELEETEDGVRKFVGAFEAINRLGEALGNLDPRSADFRAVVESLGGRRQIGRVIPLIIETTKRQEALKVAQEGENSIIEQQDKALATLAVRLSKVKEEFILLLREITQTTTFKGLVDTLLKTASAFVELATSLKPLIPLLTAFVGFKLAKAIIPIGTGFLRGARGRSSGGLLGAGGIAGSERRRPTLRQRLRIGRRGFRQGRFSGGIGFGAIAAGSLIQSGGDEPSQGRGALGGGLLGGGIGAQFGPLGAAIGTLTGAVIGASSALKELEQIAGDKEAKAGFASTERALVRKDLAGVISATSRNIQTFQKRRDRSRASSGLKALSERGGISQLLGEAGFFTTVKKGLSTGFDFASTFDIEETRRRFASNARGQIERDTQFNISGLESDLDSISKLVEGSKRPFDDFNKALESFQEVDIRLSDGTEIFRSALDNASEQLKQNVELARTRTEVQQKINIQLEKFGEGLNESSKGFISFLKNIEETSKNLDKLGTQREIRRAGLAGSLGALRGERTLSPRFNPINPETGDVGGRLQQGVSAGLISQRGAKQIEGLINISGLNDAFDNIIKKIDNSAEDIEGAELANLIKDGLLETFRGTELGSEALVLFAKAIENIEGGKLSREVALTELGPGGGGRQRILSVVDGAIEALSKIDKELGSRIVEAGLTLSDFLQIQRNINQNLFRISRARINVEEDLAQIRPGFRRPRRRRTGLPAGILSQLTQQGAELQRTRGRIQSGQGTLEDQRRFQSLTLSIDKLNETLTIETQSLQRNEEILRDLIEVEKDVIQASQNTAEDFARLDISGIVQVGRQAQTALRVLQGRPVVPGQLGGGIDLLRQLQTLLGPILSEERRGDVDERLSRSIGQAILNQPVNQAIIQGLQEFGATPQQIAELRRAIIEGTTTQEQRLIQQLEKNLNAQVEHDKAQFGVQVEILNILKAGIPGGGVGGAGGGRANQAPFIARKPIVDPIVQRLEELRNKFIQQNFPELAGPAKQAPRKQIGVAGPIPLREQGRLNIEQGREQRRKAFIQGKKQRREAFRQRGGIISKGSTFVDILRDKGGTIGDNRQARGKFNGPSENSDTFDRIVEKEGPFTKLSKKEFLKMAAGVDVRENNRAREREGLAGIKPGFNEPREARTPQEALDRVRRRNRVRAGTGNTETPRQFNDPRGGNPDTNRLLDAATSFKSASENLKNVPSTIGLAGTIDLQVNINGGQMLLEGPLSKFVENHVIMAIKKMIPSEAFKEDFVDNGVA